MYIATPGQPLIKYIYMIPRWHASGTLLVNWLASAGDVEGAALIPGSGRFPRGGHGNPLQYFCLENPMHRGAWWPTVHRVTECGKQLKRLSMYT